MGRCRLHLTPERVRADGDRGATFVGACAVVVRFDGIKRRLEVLAVGDEAANFAALVRDDPRVPALPHAERIVVVASSDVTWWPPGAEPVERELRERHHGETVVLRPFRHDRVEGLALDALLRWARAMVAPPKRWRLFLDETGVDVTVRPLPEDPVVHDQLVRALWSAFGRDRVSLDGTPPCLRGPRRRLRELPFRAYAQLLLPLLLLVLSLFAPAPRRRVFAVLGTALALAQAIEVRRFLRS